MDTIIYGADTETFEGRPMTLQFYSRDEYCDEIFFVDGKTATKTFIKWCDRRRKRCQHVLYIHNLKFDLVELLWGMKEELATPGKDFYCTAGRWTITGVYGGPTFCKLIDGHGTVIYIIDSFSFYQGSLAKAAELFCPDLPKLTRPKHLGEKLFKPSDKEFVAYAMRDAEIDYHIGKAVQKLHAQFDVKQCVSAAELASRIFRHRFLTYTIPQPDRAVTDGALYSYHGGKSCTPAPAGWYEGVYSLDIKSAYPHAMSELPAFSLRKLYRQVKFNKKIKSVPDLGVYKITGIAETCPWPAVFTHAMKPLSAEFENTWIHGFEVNEALRTGELHIEKITGFCYDGDRDPQPSALPAFVREFYQLKEKEKDPVMRNFYKLLLNSISGKFIQTKKSDQETIIDAESGEIGRASRLAAGGMCHPFIASSITAHTRARVHRLEHDYCALHTATDGIFTQKKPPRGAERADALGALACDASGTLLLMRNKLYVLYSDEGKIKSNIEGKKIAKWAHHGFQGSLKDLEYMATTGARRYITQPRPNPLKDSLKRGRVPNKFETKEMVLKVGGLPVHRGRWKPK